MLKLFGALARVVFGFALASFAAGLATVMFVNTPAEVLSLPASTLPQTASATFDLALLTATHVAIFASAFVLIVAGLGEWFSIRSLAFYLIAGITISVLGFIAQYSSEVAGQPTILNNYAIKAFVTAGFFAGFVYWLASGQFAGKAPSGEPEQVAVDIEPTPTVSPSVIAPSLENVDDGVGTEPKTRYTSLLGRLKLTRRNKMDVDAGEIAEPPGQDEVKDGAAETGEARNEEIR